MNNTVALAVIAVLWLMKRDRKAFFLVKGQMDAPIGPVRWLGIKPGESWKVFGWIFAGIAGIAVFVPTMLGISPTWNTILRALPLMPAAVLFAAVNAFTEEVYFRASLLSTLHDVVGKTHTLLITLVLSIFKPISGPATLHTLLFQKINMPWESILQLKSLHSSS